MLYLFYIFVLFILSSCGGGTNSHGPLLCEKAPHARVINGQQCTSEKNPIVQIKLEDEEGNPTLCTGSLIRSTVVLTAAHCINEFTVSARIYSGTEQASARSFTVHPHFSFDGDLFFNDVAIIEISEPISAEPLNPWNVRPASSDETIFFYGYGDSEIAPGFQGDASLREGSTQISNITDTHIFSRFNDSGLGSTQSNSCTGDSGGPVLSADQSGQIIALVSSGTREDCASGDTAAFIRIDTESIQNFLKRWQE